jgi:hypothetical protein
MNLLWFVDKLFFEDGIGKGLYIRPRNTAIFGILLQCSDVKNYWQGLPAL